MQEPSSACSQVLRIGRNDLLEGQDHAGTVVSKSTADQPVVAPSGIKNIKLGPNGLETARQQPFLHCAGAHKFCGLPKGACLLSADCTDCEG